MSFGLYSGDIMAKSLRVPRISLWSIPSLMTVKIVHHSIISLICKSNLLSIGYVDVYIWILTFSSYNGDKIEGKVVENWPVLRLSKKNPRHLPVELVALSYSPQGAILWDLLYIAFYKDFPEIPLCCSWYKTFFLSLSLRYSVTCT